MSASAFRNISSRPQRLQAIELYRDFGVITALLAGVAVSGFLTVLDDNDLQNPSAAMIARISSNDLRAVTACERSCEIVQIGEGVIHIIRAFEAGTVWHGTLGALCAAYNSEPRGVMSKFYVHGQADTLITSES